jgi:type II secretory pathway component PulM
MPALSAKINYIYVWSPAYEKEEQARNEFPFDPSAARLLEIARAIKQLGRHARPSQKTN